MAINRDMTSRKPLHSLPLDEWFDDMPHPHDSMPMATENPRPEEEVADNINMHEKMYQIATSKYNPFSVGGSESLG